MQTRRHFLTSGFSSTVAGLAGVAALMGGRGSLAEEAPPETTSLRLPQYPATCLAPLDILDDLLREEGFTNVRYLSGAQTKTPGELFTGGEVDFDQDFSPVAALSIDTGRAHGYAGWSALPAVSNWSRAIQFAALSI
jgi:NitT/TauT family transport system substrate-binding protein